MNGIRLIREWFLEGYDKEYFEAYRSEIERYNTGILTFFNVLVMALLVFVFVSGFFTGYVAPMQRVYVGTAVFTLLETAAGRRILFQSSRGIEAAVFLCMMKIYVFCIISGVSYSLNMPAISFFVFMIVMSILFIARPWKLELFNFLAGTVFCICSFRAKPLSMAMADIYNCWVFYGVASAVSFWIVKLRVGFIRNENLLIVQRDTDILTTLPNRRRFDIYAKEAFETHRMGPCSFLMMDIDHFKAYNDTKGHIAGDYCLERIGKALGKLGRERGIFFARYGGEEFVAVDTMRSSRELENIAGEIVRTIYELGLPHENSSFKRITISVGYACQADVEAEDYIRLLDCADKALYCAKQHGRNKIADYAEANRNQ